MSIYNVDFVKNTFSPGGEKYIAIFGDNIHIWTCCGELKFSVATGVMYIFATGDERSVFTSEMNINLCTDL